MSLVPGDGLYKFAGWGSVNRTSVALEMGAPTPLSGMVAEVVTGNLFFAFIDRSARHLHTNPAVYTVLDISRVSCCDATANPVFVKNDCARSNLKHYKLHIRNTSGLHFNCIYSTVYEFTYRCV